jgi:hypothetical protein
VIEEIVHGVVHFDTKAWRTLPMVLFRPGTLTRNYVYGKRARYISPIALFLFTIFFMFFVFAFALPDHAPQPMTRAEVEQELTRARQALTEIEAEVAAARAASAALGDGQTLGDQAAALARAEVGRLERALEHMNGQSGGAAPARPGSGLPINASIQVDGEPVIVYRDTNTIADVMRQAAQSEDFVFIAGMPELNERVRKKFENPELAFYKIQQAAYKFSFLLAPLSLPFIALLFLWKRGVTLYDHMAYALYALSFASLLFVSIMLMSDVSWLRWAPAMLVFVGLPVHTFFHLKGAYALGWFSALWRTLFMLGFALVIITIFIMLITLLGLAG